MNGRTNLIIGVGAAMLVTCIWSGWLVVSRSGAQTSLTFYDIAALRFGVAGLVTIPIVLWLRPWRSLTLHRMLVLAAVIGIPYTLIIYAAFALAPAAHGGVFMNGLLPAMTLALGWLWLGQKPHPLQGVGAVLIVAGAALATLDGGNLAVPGAWRGDLLFVLGGAIFAVYLVLNRLWQVTIPQVFLCASVLNSIVYMPIWALFLPSGMADASWSQIGLQAFYQGLVPSLIGLVLISIAVRRVGASVTAAVMSAVPALGALLGYFVLGERLGPLGWASLFVLTPGIILTAIAWHGLLGPRR